VNAKPIIHVGIALILLGVVALLIKEAAIQATRRPSTPGAFKPPLTPSRLVRSRQSWAD